MPLPKHEKDLTPESKGAYICLFVCTFCVDCVTQRLNDQCPNCGGGLVRRPIRPEASLLRHPASSQRHYKQ
ncbi:TPA: DUF1272 domain-containing protein [Enterobacter cancerogenus]|uniref:DUF1272 domain-containing protein n=1 Tax=Enterobacter cancerogenus TaxID=69218 RepID=UPI0008FBEC0B|nr:DUF1272 domain-containing protein [Enterobacter cancerogenus]MDT7009105.1 DUF1272 domain-containing protein [Enterobacter cancerogenus]WNN58920.1 DUF1272 domain-containing protein [Enterobacter cancerogenus]